MKAWRDFYDLVVPDLPGCPMTAIDIALRLGAIAFCEQSQAWKYALPDIQVVVGTALYPFSSGPVGAVVHAISYAQFNDSEIEVNTMADDMRIWDWRHQTGTPQYVLGGPTMVTLVPMPDTDGTLSLIAILKPAPTAEGIDDDIYNEYRQVIVHWALARLMFSPKKPYSNSALGAYHMQKFDAKTAAAGMRTDRDYTRAHLQTAIMRRR